ncbi:hypothetical protein SZ54_3168 [Rhizobium sp. UR51a]|nr:hypothetical protein SZ54_3168 [Rhizobium sp. UR51a]
MATRNLGQEFRVSPEISGSWEPEILLFTLHSGSARID